VKAMAAADVVVATAGGGGGGNETGAETAVNRTNVADAVFDKTSRLVVLYVQISVGAVGGALVALWLCPSVRPSVCHIQSPVALWLCVNRRRTSRVNTIISILPPTNFPPLPARSTCFSLPLRRRRTGVHTGCAVI